MNFVLHHLSPPQLIANIAGNLLTHIFDLFGDFWGLATNLMGGHWFALGKDVG